MGIDFCIIFLLKQRCVYSQYLQYGPSWILNTTEQILYWFMRNDEKELIVVVDSDFLTLTVLQFYNT